MTLAEWIKQGGCMLSTIAARMCRKELGINERLLRQMELAELFNIRDWGCVAEREIRRFASQDGNGLSQRARQVLAITADVEGVGRNR